MGGRGMGGGVGGWGWGVGGGGACLNEVNLGMDTAQKVSN